MTAALAATLALSMPMAFAQTTRETTPPSTTAAPMRSMTHETATRAGAMTSMMPDQIRVTEMDGSTVYDTQNRNIGDVKDIILDKDGRVAAVILDVGSFLGMGGKMVAVPMSDVKVSFKDNNSNKPRFTVNMTKEQLKSAQAFEFNQKNAASGSSTPPANNPPPARK
jgi:sporulation protein YlmC with PRC-barrel domain